MERSEDWTNTFITSVLLLIYMMILPHQPLLMKLKQITIDYCQRLRKD